MRRSRDTAMRSRCSTRMRMLRPRPEPTEKELRSLIEYQIAVKRLMKWMDTLPPILRKMVHRYGARLVHEWMTKPLPKLTLKDQEKLWNQYLFGRTASPVSDGNDSR